MSGRGYRRLQHKARRASRGGGVSSLKSLEERRTSVGANRRTPDIKLWPFKVKSGPAGAAHASRGVPERLECGGVC